MRTTFGQLDRQTEHELQLGQSSADFLVGKGRYTRVRVLGEGSKGKRLESFHGLGLRRFALVCSLPAISLGTLWTSGHGAEGFQLEGYRHMLPECHCAI